MEIDEIDGKDGHVYRLKFFYEIQKILIGERDKRNALSTSKVITLTKELMLLV